MNKTQDMLDFEKFLENNYIGPLNLETFESFGFTEMEPVEIYYKNDTTMYTFQIWRHIKEHGHE